MRKFKTTEERGQLGAIEDHVSFMLRIKAQTNELITYATQDNLNKALIYAESLVANISDRMQAQMDIEDEGRERGEGEGEVVVEDRSTTHEYEFR